MLPLLVLRWHESSVKFVLLNALLVHNSLFKFLYKGKFLTQNSLLVLHVAFS